MDLKSDEIHDFPPMLSERTRPSAALLNDAIYVFGGLNEHRYMCHTVER